MRWEGRAESGNVEDRRGMGGGGMRMGLPVGGGIGGVVLLLIVSALTGTNPLDLIGGGSVDESGLTRVEAIINSMTPLERKRPDVLNGSRKKRIAMGSGTSVAEINRLLKQYAQMRKMMKGVQGKWLRRAMGMGGQARA